MIYRSRTIVSLLTTTAAILIVAGCGGGKAAITLDSFDNETQNLVRFESAWQCDVGRFAVDDLSELDGMKVARQLEFGVSDDAYAAFVDQLATNEALRATVVVETSNCLGVGEPVQL